MDKNIFYLQYVVFFDEVCEKFKGLFVDLKTN